MQVLKNILITKNAVKNFFRNKTLRFKIENNATEKMG